MQNNLLRYQTGLETSESDTRKILGRPKKKLICMLLRLQQAEQLLDKYKGNREYHPLVKVCTATTLALMMKIALPLPLILTKVLTVFKGLHVCVKINNKAFVAFLLWQDDITQLLHRDTFFF